MRAVSGPPPVFMQHVQQFLGGSRSAERSNGHQRHCSLKAMQILSGCDFVSSRCLPHTSVTMPQHSSPSSLEAPGGAGYVPCLWNASARLMAAVRVLMRTSLGFRSGFGSS